MLANHVTTRKGLGKYEQEHLLPGSTWGLKISIHNTGWSKFFKDENKLPPDEKFHVWDNTNGKIRYLDHCQYTDSYQQGSVLYEGNCFQPSRKILIQAFVKEITLIL